METHTVTAESITAGLITLDVFQSALEKSGIPPLTPEQISTEQPVTIYQWGAIQILYTLIQTGNVESSLVETLYAIEQAQLSRHETTTSNGASSHVLLSEDAY